MNADRVPGAGLSTPVDSTADNDVGSAGPGAPRSLEEGSVFAGRYEIRKIVGRGGMGEVYEAADRSRPDRPVALKTIRVDRLGSDAFRRRFVRECETNRKLDHPTTARLLDYGFAGNVPYFTMELLAGETLAERLARSGRLSPAQLVPLLRDVSQALDHAHSRGVIHRDVKPSNVFLTKEKAVLMDFGLARPMDLSGTPLTESSYVMGTLSYSSPEQVLDRELTPATDVYSLGVSVFEALTGRLPFEGSTPVAQATARLTSQPLRLRDALRDAPPALDDLLGRCLAREAAARPKTAGDVAREFARVVEKGSGSFLFRRAARWVAVLLVAAACLGFTSLVVRRSFGARPMGRFRLVGHPLVRRDGHTAVLLDSGRVWIAGGSSSKTMVGLSSTELFDPRTEAFSAGPSLLGPRGAHVAIPLGHGDVLVVGGDNGPASAVAGAELYNEDRNEVVAAGQLAVPRDAHSATLLPDNRVLVAGGGYGAKKPLSSTEIWDRTTKGFSPGPPLLEPRFFHTACTLADGRVLIVGGWGGAGRAGLLSSAEVFDPRTNRFSSAGRMNAGRYDPTATLLLDGRVLLTGGYTIKSELLQTAETYDPRTGSFHYVEPMREGRCFGAAVLLKSGRVLVVGGEREDSGLQPFAELFDPVRNRFDPLGRVVGHHYGIRAVRLLNGSVLLVGGQGGFTYVRAAQLYEPEATP